MSSAARKLVIESRPSHGPIDTPWGARLRQIEERIADNETTSIRARWESGRHLLSKREGKQLPRGLLNEAAGVLGVSRSELHKRMQFADACPTEKEVRNALRTSPTWRQIVSKVLPKKSEPETEEQKYAKQFRSFLRAGHREMDRFDPEWLQSEDLDALAKLSQRINTFLQAVR